MESGKQNVTEPEREREVVLTRVYTVPAKYLFLACSKPEHLAQWFGPKGYPVGLCEMDFRVGGRYRLALRGPDGALMTPFGGEYLAIEPDRKISYSNAFELPGAETMVQTFTFSEAGGKTTLTMHTLFGSIAMKLHHLAMGYENGAGSALDQLGGLVERLARP